MVKTIYISRHGYRSNWVLDKPLPPPPTGIPADPVLADHGLDQAAELGAHLATLKDAPIQQIYCSPYYRCVQTATPASKTLGLKLFIEHGVSEWLSRLSYDKSPLPAPTSDLANKYFSPSLIDESYTPVIDHSTVGETYDQLLARTKDFVAKLIARLDSEAPHIENILIVTHAATKIALGRALLHDDYIDIRTGTCSLDTYVRDPEAPENWIAKSLGQTSYLTNGEEMHWNFDMAYAPGSTEDMAARLQGSDGQVRTNDTQEKATESLLDSEPEPEELATVYVTLDLSQAQQDFLGDFASFYTKKKPLNDDGLSLDADEEEDADEEVDLDVEDGQDNADDEDDEEDDAGAAGTSSGLLDEQLDTHGWAQRHARRYARGTRSTLRSRFLSSQEEGQQQQQQQTPPPPDHHLDPNNSSQRTRRHENQQRVRAREATTVSLTRGAGIQIVDLASDAPLFRVGKDLYVGVWEDLVGTELYTNLEGEVVGKTRTRIHLVPAKVKSKVLQVPGEDEPSREEDVAPLVNLSPAEPADASTAAGATSGAQDSDVEMVEGEGRPPTGGSGQGTPRKRQPNVDQSAAVPSTPKNPFGLSSHHGAAVTVAVTASPSAPATTNVATTPRKDADTGAAVAAAAAAAANAATGAASAAASAPAVHTGVSMRLLDRMKAINLRRVAVEGPPEPSPRTKRELERPAQTEPVAGAEKEKEQEQEQEDTGSTAAAVAAAAAAAAAAEAADQDVDMASESSSDDHQSAEEPENEEPAVRATE